MYVTVARWCSLTGCHAAAGNYIEMVLLAAIVVGGPLYYYRTRLVARFRRKPAHGTDRSGYPLVMKLRQRP
jgi:hypothetical protein